MIANAMNVPTRRKIWKAVTAPSAVTVIVFEFPSRSCWGAFRTMLIGLSVEQSHGCVFESPELVGQVVIGHSQVTGGLVLDC